MKKHYNCAGTMQRLFTLLDSITEVAERIVNHMEKELKISDKGTVIRTGRIFA